MGKVKAMSGSDADQVVIRAVAACKAEADLARRDRMQTNKRNFDFYHLRQNFSHKKAGQSQEFLAKQSMSVEQITSFIHQGLVDLGEWFSVEPEVGNRKPMFSHDEARVLVSRQLTKANFYTFIQDALKSGLLGSLMIAKVHGRNVEKPHFFTEKSLGFLGMKTLLKKRRDKVWESRIDLVRQQNFFPDPTGDGLYEIELIESDLWKVKAMAREAPDVYDMSQVDALDSYLGTLEQGTKERETAQNVTNSMFRKRVILTEYWGTIVDESGEVIHENVVCTVANDRFLIRKPQPNPFWHGRSPYIAVPIIRVPHSVWHKALMDEPTALNAAMNELYNLLLDSGIMSVYGVRQIREGWIDNAEEIVDGIAPGAVLKANMSCPPGQKVLETISTGTLSQEALSVFNLTNAEYQASALTSDLRMGVLPSRSVKATEVVESSQSITSVFAGVAKTIESSFIKPLLDLVWLTSMQHMDDLDSDELIALFGEARARELAAVKPQERFEKSVRGHQFQVFGVTETLNKIKDFRKLTSMLQTIGSNPTLMEEFQKNYDFGKLLTEIMRALDVNTDRIKLGDSDAVMTQLGASARAGSAPSPGPDMQSQIPQMGGAEPAGGPPVPHTQFPITGGSVGGGA